MVLIEKSRELDTRKAWNSGAQKRTRTSTIFRSPAPEAGASTNFAIWAMGSIIGGIWLFFYPT